MDIHNQRLPSTIEPSNLGKLTPNAALAVRGTHFCAGSIEGKYGILLLKGKMRVSER